MGMGMMDMLLMSPMRALLPTQRLPQLLLMLPQLIMPQLLLTLLQLLLTLLQLLLMLSMLLQWLLPTLSMPQLPTPQCLLLLLQLTMVPTSQSRENTDPPPRARPLDPTPLLSLMPPTDFTEPRELLLMLSMPQLLPTLLPQLLFLVKPTNHLV